MPKGEWPPGMDPEDLDLYWSVNERVVSAIKRIARTGPRRDIDVYVLLVIPRTFEVVKIVLNIASGLSCKPIVQADHLCLKVNGHQGWTQKIWISIGP